MAHAFTVDVEEWYEGFRYRNIGGWEDCQPTLEGDVERILELLAEYSAGATFFILASVARGHVKLVRRIVAAGHEVGCHGAAHVPVYTRTPEEFREDVRSSLCALEDIVGDRVIGFRAPFFSITRRCRWAFEVLVELGFRYDSSVNPVFRLMHGDPAGPRFPRRLANGLLEIPITTWRVLGFNLPVAGGVYLRGLPLWVARQGLRQASRAGSPGVLYLHPRDLNVHLPRVKGLRIDVWAMYYLGLHRMLPRLHELLSEFRFTSIGKAFDVL